MTSAAIACPTAHTPRGVTIVLRRRWIGAVVAFSVIAAATLATAWIGGRDHGSQDRSTARAIIAQANAIRMRNGQQPLVASAELTRAAEAYAREMAARGTLDHTGQDGSTVDARAEAHGYRAWNVLAENLASGSGTRDASDIVEAWLRSAEHRRNVLSPDLRDAGAGCYVVRTEPPRYWCAMEFGTRAP